MNLKMLVKLSNIVALVAILLLIYWVFVFISVEVFGLKIFRENISQTFTMSVLGIIALMAGSLMINVMFNLTRIAEKHNRDKTTELKGVTKKLGWVFLLSFPLVFGLLFGGDYLTSKKKEAVLIDSAKSVIEKYPQKIDGLLDYQFSRDWLVTTDGTVDLMKKTDKNFPNAMVIVKDSIDNSDVFLGFRGYTPRDDTPDLPNKVAFIFETTKPERDYLNKVFNEDYNEIRFSASDGNYQLYYPYSKDDKKIVLYFSDYQRYGKFGS
ncbi:MAG: peptidase [Pyrinomonadaceae bacterium]